MPIELIAIIIIGSLFLLLFIGMPIAFALTGLSTFLILVLFGPKELFMIVAAIANQIRTEVLLAIPMFVLMAVVLQFSGIASSIYDTLYRLLGGLKGGLAMSTIVASAIIAAMTGIGATGTVTMGLIALPEMERRKYNSKLSIGSVTVGGALGPIIPPSNLMIIVGGYAALSVGKLFMGGIIPGILITLFYCLYIGIRCLLRPEDGPALSSEERSTFIEKILSLRNLIMPFALIFSVLGAIYGGICTPTEAAGIGAAGAMVIAAINRKLTFKNIHSAVKQTMIVTSMIMWLVIGGGCYTSLVNISGLGSLVVEFLKTAEFGAYGLIAFILGITLVMGMFIDPVAICMICIPIFIPGIRAAGLDLFWVMLLFVVAVTIGYITPPFGLNLFYARGVVPPKVQMLDIYRSVIPFVILKIMVLILMVIFPKIGLWLPSMIK